MCWMCGAFQVIIIGTDTKGEEHMYRYINLDDKEHIMPCGLFWSDIKMISNKGFLFYINRIFHNDI